MDELLPNWELEFILIGFWILVGVMAWMVWQVRKERKAKKIKAAEVELQRHLEEMKKQYSAEGDTEDEVSDSVPKDTNGG
jgi:hypothetical protein